VSLEHVNDAARRQIPQPQSLVGRSGQRPGAVGAQREREHVALMTFERADDPILVDAPHPYDIRRSAAGHAEPAVAGDGQQ
jgi:hypothetical protein